MLIFIWINNEDSQHGLQQKVIENFVLQFKNGSTPYRIVFWRIK